MQYAWLGTVKDRAMVQDKLQALIFDSYYDAYRGIVISVRVMNGKLKVGDTIRMMNNNVSYLVTDIMVSTIIKLMQ